MTSNNNQEMAICKILKSCLSFYFSDIYFAVSPTLDDTHEFRGCGRHWCVCTVGILAPGRMVSSGRHIHLPLHHFALSLCQDLNPLHLSTCVSCSSLPDGEHAVHSQFHTLSIAVLTSIRVAICPLHLFAK